MNTTVAPTTENIWFIHSCAGGGCEQPLGSASWSAWVHEDGTNSCGAGLGVLERDDFRADVPIPDWVLIARSKPDTH